MLHSTSDELRQIAEMFEMSMKEVITDFTHIAIGDDIASALITEGDESGDDDNCS